jgi:putative drug exporter of the RND superfamily
MRAATRQPMTVRVARWSAGHPWRAIVGWFLFVALCLALGSAIGTNGATSADYRVGEAGRAEAIAAEGNLSRPPTEQVLIDSPSAPLDRTAVDAAAQDVVVRMRALAEVQRVDDPVRSEDGKVVRVSVAMKGEELAARKHTGPLIDQTAAVQAAYPNLRIEETGHPSMSKGLDKQRGDDLALSEAITLPVRW